MQEIFNTLSVVGSSVAGVLLVLLLTLRNEQRYANKLLIPFVLTFCLALLQSQMEEGIQWYEHPFFRIFSASWFFLAGPSLLSYSRYLFYQQKVTLKQAPHLIPFIVILLFGWTSYNDSPLFRDFWAWQQRLLYLQLTSYCISVLFLVKQAEKFAVNEYSNYLYIHLNWVTALCASVLSLLALDTLMGIAIYIFQFEVPMAHNTMMSAIAMAIIGITFCSLRQPIIIYGISGAGDEGQAHADNSPDEKYQKSSLSESQAEYYLDKLSHQMTEKQLFLDNQLTLSELANRLSMSRHHLSQIINEYLSINFYDYINALRVKEAQKLLENDHLSVTEICYASGFANKATFNSAFKKLTSTTPTQWRKKEK